MTRCPDTGALRAALDAERPDIEAHVHDCEPCRLRTEELTDNAAFAEHAFAEASSAVDVDAALTRREGEQVVIPMRRSRSEPRRRMVLGRAAAVALVVAVTGGALATPDGRAAANSLLERFRSEQVAVVPFNAKNVDFAALEALADVAEVEGATDLIEPTEVADVSAASAIAGFSVKPLDPGSLPSSATGPVRVLVQAPQSVRVSFPERADVPPAMRDAVLVVDIPGAIVQVVGDTNDRPAVLRGEAGSLQIRIEGDASLAEVRDALLSLPGLPPETVNALREIEDWETTLPLPVPTDKVVWRETDVNGKPALSFGDNTGLGSALLWRDGDRFIGVGGMIPLSDVRDLAEAK
jgi:hypothetical protein